MQQDRFLYLITRELQAALTPAEHAELQAALRTFPGLAAQRQVWQQYWHNTRAEQPSRHSTAQAFEHLKAQLGADWVEAAPQPQITGLAARRRNRRWWAIAASLFIMAGIAGEWWISHRGPAPVVALSSKHNDKGNRSLILLPDGSRVWLNAASDLQYPEHFTGKDRRVVLTGEAFFDVARDAAHPFIIHTRKMDIRVLGTSFNVKAYPEEATTEATLVTGSIEVHLKDRPEAAIRLKPNEKLVIPNNTTTDTATRIMSLPQLVISKPTYLSLDATTDSSMIETAWVQNKLMFKEESFATLAKRLEKWYNVTITFRSATAARLTFTGVFTTESLPAALHALQLTEPFKYQVKGGEVVIY